MSQQDARRAPKLTPVAVDPAGHEGLQPRAAYFIQSLARGLDIIRAFDRDTPELTCSGVAKKVGLSRGTAQRFLQTLSDLGYVECEGQRFSLRPKVMGLGFAYLASHEFWDAIEPFLAEVVRELNESCTVGVLDWPDVVYVSRVQARRAVNVALNVGTRVPAASSSLGRVMLAALDRPVLEGLLQSHPLKQRTPRTVSGSKQFYAMLEDVRERGWALSDEESEPGAISVAVPLFDRLGKVIAAMKVVAPTNRATPAEVVDRMLPLLQQAAIRANAALAGR